MGDVFYPYAVAFDDAGTKVLIDGVSDQGIDPGIAVQRPLADGQAYPQNIFTGITEPVIDITTQSIAKALAEITLTGQVMSGDNPFEMYCQKAEDGGVRAGASKHLKLDDVTALVYLQSLSAPVEPPATLSFRVAAKEDGTNKPFVFTADQSLPADTLNTVEEYCAGPVTINGVSITQVVGIDIAFNITTRPVWTGANVGTAPDHISILSITPAISITTLDAKLVSDYKDLTAYASSTIFYLRKCSTAGRVAAATAQHIKFTVTAGGIAARPISGADQAGVIEILPVFDGTNAILQINTASAIT
jgi:hypothetical protein